MADGLNELHQQLEELEVCVMQLQWLCWGCIASSFAPFYSAAERHSLLHRFRSSPQAVESVYPGALVLGPTEQEALHLAKEAAASSGASRPDWLAELGGMLTVPAPLQLSGRPVSLRFSLPALYPDASSPAQLSLDCSAPRQLHDQLCRELSERAAGEWAGAPCLLLALDYLEERLNGLAADEEGLHQRTDGDPAAASTPESSMQEAAPTSNTQQQLGRSSSAKLMRAAVWFHHIKNLDKRKRIVSWARELRLRGASKPGMPGAIVCEGVEEHVREYLSRIRSLKWQAMQLRSEQLVVVDAAGTEQQQQRLAWGFDEGLVFQELPETGMSELGQLCRDAGLEELFLSLLKL